MQPETDETLIKLARAGDKQALGELFERYQQMALSIAYRMIGQEEVARELVQEAFLSAFLSLHQLRDVQRFKSWLYSIVLNVCRSYLRNRTYNVCSLESLIGGTNHETLVGPDTLIDPQEIAEERELHQTVLNAVQKLSPKERIATLLFYYEQLSIHEIATILQISETAVKSRLYQARKRLIDTTTEKREDEHGRDEH